jgi:diacylglycerol kinase family enzyme
MDLGEVDGRAFVGIASVGFDSDANRIANLAPAWLGSGVYAYGALRALLRWRPANFQLELYPRPPATQDRSARPQGALTTDAERIQFDGYSVAFANSRCFGGGMRLAPSALLDDGLLDVVRIDQMTRARYAWHLPKVFRGTHLSVRTVHVHRIAEAVISADRPFTMYADGDPIGELPVRIRLLPGAVNVLTPALCPEGFATSSRGRRMPARLPEEAPGAPVSELSGGVPGDASLA